MIRSVVRGIGSALPRRIMKNADFEGVVELRLLPKVRIDAVTRMKRQPLTLCIAGERKTVDNTGEPTYTAIYEIESPEVLVSDAWAKAVEDGRWPEHVRPHTSNRHHTLQKITG